MNMAYKIKVVFVSKFSNDFCKSEQYTIIFTSIQCLYQKQTRNLGESKI